MLTRCLALLAGVFLLGLPLNRLAVRIVRRRGILDDPNWRSSHDRPVPRGAGLGMILALVPGVPAGAWLLSGGELGTAGALLAAALITAGAGLWDDVKGVRPAPKFALQLAAAGLAVVVLGPLKEVVLPGLGRVPLSAASVPLTLFWLTGFSNAFNFMDGIDGIAALHAGVAALFLTGAAALSGSPAPGLFLLPLAGAALSFLGVNWHPAKAFMGDAGSLPLGFLLAAGAVAGARWSGVPFVTSFLCLGPFLFDTVYTLGRRILRGENILSAHRSHLYQRLAAAGLGHARVAAIYGGWTVLTGGLGLLYLLQSPGLRAAALGAALASGVAMARVVGRREGRSAPGRTLEG